MLPSETPADTPTPVSLIPDWKTAIGCCLCVVFLLLFLAAIYGMLFGVAPPESHSVPVSSARSTTDLHWRGARYGWCALLTAALCYTLFKGKARQSWRFCREIRPIMVIQNLGILILVGLCMAGLRFGFPFLDRSWLYLFPLNDGKAVNINLLPASLPYVGLVFVALFTLNLPAFAYSEERSYRNGTKDWKQGLLRSLRFGLAHCFVGIPLYAGLGLSVGGLWFTHQYFKGGIERSTVHHLTYNLIAVSMLVVYLLLSGVKF